MSKVKTLSHFILLSLTLGTRRAAFKKANYLRNKNIFKRYGEGGYWHPLHIPSFPEWISIGDNVTVCADVKFYEHDIVHRMWNGDKNYNGEALQQYHGEIVIGDNVVIGGNSIILYDVHIGNNALIAAGSLVVKDVEPFAIVGGNPAKKIGDTRELYEKRLAFTRNNRGDTK